VLRSSFGSFGSKRSSHLGLEALELALELGQLLAGELGELGIGQRLAIFGDLALDARQPAERGDDRLELRRAPCSAWSSCAWSVSTSWLQSRCSSSA
jgi:hypothetical protein